MILTRRFCPLAQLPVKIEGQEILGIGSEVMLLDMEEAADHQSGSDQEHQRQRDLSCDQSLAEPLPCCSSGAASAGFFEGMNQVGLRYLNCRDHAKNQAGEDHYESRESQHAQVERNFIQAREIGRRCAQKEVESAPAQQDSCQTSQNR